MPIPWAIIASAVVVVAAAVIIIDRTARKSHALWHAAFFGSPAPAIHALRDGRVLEVNPAFRRWAHLGDTDSVNDLLLEPPITPERSGSDTASRRALLAALAAGRPWTGELWIHIGREWRCIESALVPAPGNRASVLHLESGPAIVPSSSAEFPPGLFQTLVDDGVDGMLVLRDDHVMYANTAAALLLGFETPGAMLGFNFIETIAPASRDMFSNAIRDRGLGTPVLTHAEVRGLTRQGRVVDMEVTARIVAWRSERAVEVFVRDMTERKMLEREQALWHWEQQALSEIDRNIVGVSDLRTILESILRHATNLLRAEWSAVLTVDAELRSATWRMARGGKMPGDAAQPADLSLFGFLRDRSLRIVQEDDSELPPEVTQLLGSEDLRTMVWSPLREGGETVGALVVGFRSRREAQRRELRLLDSLAEKTAIAMLNARRYERVLDRERELEMLSVSRVEAQEEERRRIAKEIHDGIGQMLTAIKFNLEILEDSIPAGTEERTRVDDMKALLDNLMKEAREMSYTLMPSVLEDFGLVPALQMLCEQFGKKHRIRALFQNHGLTGRLRRNLEVSLYRIAQEALGNVARHAAAGEVTVQVIHRGQRLRLVCEDDGKGMTQAAATTGGIGLVSMRERASQFGGTVTVDSSPGKGTVVSVEIPLGMENPS